MLGSRRDSPVSESRFKKLVVQNRGRASMPAGVGQEPVGDAEGSPAGRYGESIGEVGDRCVAVDDRNNETSLCAKQATARR